jgi:hypothetical protein
MATGNVGITCEELVKLGSRDPDHGFVEGEVGYVRPGYRVAREEWK